jgi:hypothetical protein
MGRWFTNPERSGFTKTLLFRGAALADEPALAVRVLPEGDTWTLESFVTGRERLVWISVGAKDHRDITLSHIDPEIGRQTVSALHCMLCFDRDHRRVSVVDSESHNGTFVDNVRVSDSLIEATTSAVIWVGGARLLVLGEAGAEQKPRSFGTDATEFAGNARELYPSERQAAKATGFGRGRFAALMKLFRGKR